MNNNSKLNSKIKNLNFLQSELNGILGSFINGGFSSKGYLFYPLIKDVSPILADKMRNLMVFADSCSELDFESLSSLKKGRRNFTKYSSLRNPSFFSKLISSLYTDFEHNKKRSGINTASRKIMTKTIKDRDYNSNYLKPVLELKKFAVNNLSEYLFDFHLHGSLSTLDYIKGWTDFDTLAIISRETLMDWRNLISLRDLMYSSKIYLYKIDPLQHHGHMIFTEIEIDYYCNTFFPVELFAYSKSFFGEKSIKFNLRECRDEDIKVFEWFCNYFKELPEDSRLCSYDLKFFLHAVALFPTIYLQAKGRNMYKKFSFEKARNDFGKEYRVIDEFSSIRKNWKQLNTFPLLSPLKKLNPLLAYQLNAKYWDYTKDISAINKINFKRLCSGIKNLVSAAENKIYGYKD